MNDDRRKHERLEPKDLTFAALRPGFSKLGKILDVSKRGLCFQYVTSQGEQTEASTHIEIDVFMSDETYYLPGIPSKMVYDREIQEGMDYPKGVEYGRCGLKFGKLTKDQASQWDFFLENHTKQ